ncbi:MAG: carbamoyltransferase HypF [Nocardioides sp.]
MLDGVLVPPTRMRLRVEVRGLVQGVGFRPFVHALAHRLGLTGFVANTAEGVVVEVEGGAAEVQEFAARVRSDAPVLAHVEDVVTEPVDALGGSGFEIRDSLAGSGRTFVSPDVATCDDCLAELSDPGNRRYRHPFVSCTNCGPRYTIVTGLPYDRPTTTMAGFPLCRQCADEYADPSDRRFHAQPICCPDCGPRLRLLGPAGPVRAAAAAVAAARRVLADGAILAVKGLGGYHLACDAESPSAVSMLRKRKRRGDKPFAVMVATPEVAALVARLDEVERLVLAGHQRPIVLLRRHPAYDGGRLPLADDVAPGNPDLGVMLPYTPVHHLLLGLPGDAAAPRVLVMTSGNVAGEPIVTDDDDAQIRLADLADAWLTHDRPIHVPCDDSVVRVIDGHPLPVRRSRGYAPMPVHLPFVTEPVLAVGGDLKNTFALAAGRRAWLSGHVGDMDDYRTQRAFAAAEQHLEELTGIEPQALASDLHPGYRSRRWAGAHAAGRPLSLVQHHHAHVASTLADRGHDGTRPVLGVAFDGTGYGEDGAVWGGEFLVADYRAFTRLAHLAYVPLPGGDAAVANPCRMALSHLRAAGTAWSADLPSMATCSPDELGLLEGMLERGSGCVPTSSMGRLFDAVASLAGVCHRAGYEAQAAIELEGLARTAGADGERYAFPAPDRDGSVPCAPVIAAVAADVRRGVDPAVVSARFHRAVVRLVTDIARLARDRHGIDEVTLSGGVFVNAVLTAWCRDGLGAAGFHVLTHRSVPPTDAGLALGQVAIHAHRSATPLGNHQAVRPPETENPCV